MSERVKRLALFLALMWALIDSARGATSIPVPSPFTREEFNVKAYGARGATRRVYDAATTNGDQTVTSATGNFTSADVGKIVYAHGPHSATMVVPRGTITAVNSATSIEVSLAAISTNAALVLTLGYDDTAAIQAAVTAAKAARPPGKVRIPAGGYLFDECIIDFSYAGADTIMAIGVEGDGSNSTFLYADATFDVATATTNHGAFMKHTSGGNVLQAKISGVTFDGGYFPYSSATNYYATEVAVYKSHVVDLRVINCDGFAGALYVLGAQSLFERIHCEAASGRGLVCQGTAHFYQCYTGNHGTLGLYVYGLGDDSAFTTDDFLWLGGTIDESVPAGGSSVYIDSSRICNFIGATMFAGSGNAALFVNGSSTANLIRCKVIPWSTSGNRSGASVASGGIINAQATLFAKVGTGVSLANSGTVNDLGGNTFGTVTGTAVVTPYQAADSDLTTWAGVTPGSGVATFLATPSSANLATAVTGETGSGALVFGTSPTLTTPNIGVASGSSLTTSDGFIVGTSAASHAISRANSPIGNLQRVIFNSATNAGGSNGGYDFYADASSFNSPSTSTLRFRILPSNAAELINTYSTETNFELLRMSWESNVARIGTVKGSGAGSARGLALMTDNVNRLTISAAGEVAIPSARINPDVQSVTSSATVTPAGDTDEMVVITAQAAGLTLAAPSGTPVNGQKLLIRIKDNGTSRSITWNAIYRSVVGTLPTATTISKTHYVGFVYNSADSKWDCLAAGVEP